jgi:uncharacterized membrane protein YphA (DoxX/SURF4 family)
MLSLFPQILFLSPISATLLRVCGGLTFTYLAYAHFSNRRAASEELSRLIGAARIIIPVYSIIELVIAVFLVGGAYTQLAALIGSIITFKMLFVRHTLRELKPLSQASYALLAVICLSLVFTGAGAFAIDLPL